MNPSKVSANRYALLDELRGLDLISMMCYHGLWDVVFLFGVQLPWYTGMPGHLWQQSICWVFILLSGFCLPMGHHPYKRGALVFGAGALVTAVTVFFMPEDVVLFGVLTLLGSAMGITALLEKALRKIPPAVGAVVSVALFGLTYMPSWGISVLAMAGCCCRVFCTRTSLPPTSGFTQRGSSPPITSRWCPGCFCSGQASSCTTW